MNRRLFTALLSLGTTVLGLPRAAGAPPEKDGGTAPPAPGPVSVDDFRVLARAKLPKASASRCCRRCSQESPRLTSRRSS